MGIIKWFNWKLDATPSLSSQSARVKNTGLVYTNEYTVFLPPITFPRLISAFIKKFLAEIQKRL